MKKIISFIVIALFYSIAVSSAFGAWQGPVTILEGGWGSATGQFGIRSGDTADEFPSMLAISPSGKILIGDSFNIRIQIFNADGTFNSIITPRGFPTTYRPATYWPLSLFICGGQIYTERNEYIQIYDMSGNLTNNFTNLDGGIIFIDQQCNFYTYNPSAKRYSLYSPTGQLIKTSTTKPPELGTVTEKSLGSGKYKVTVTYPDKVWSYIGAGSAAPYIRDANGSLYSTGGTQAIRWDYCGRELARLSMPQAVTGSNFVEYGPANIAPNGDVYTWKRTPTTYSIIKWNWVDDPNTPTGPDAPTNLAVAASINGLYLTWTASPQDPGCVTGYEIDQATTSGGPYTVLTTVNAGVLKYNDTSATAGTMYYYKVRAVSGSDYSLYTTEVSGKR